MIWKTPQPFLFFKLCYKKSFRFIVLFIPKPRNKNWYVYLFGGHQLSGFCWGSVKETVSNCLTGLFLMPFFIAYSNLYQLIRLKPFKTYKSHEFIRNLIIFQLLLGFFCRDDSTFRQFWLFLVLTTDDWLVWVSWSPKVQLKIKLFANKNDSRETNKSPLWAWRHSRCVACH